jgi:hypothetical protein
MRKKLTVFLVIALMMIGNVVPVLADTLISLSISASQDSYVRGSNVVVTGTVLKDNIAGKGVNPTITLKDPNNSIVDIDQVSDSQIGNNGSFTLTFVLGASAMTGTYTLEANGGGQTDTDTFAVVSTNDVTVSVNKASYALGEEVSISGLIKKDGQAVGNTSVTIAIKKNNTNVTTQNVTATNGSFSWKYKPTTTGSYEVDVTSAATGAQTGSTSFTVDGVRDTITVSTSGLHYKDEAVIFTGTVKRFNQPFATDVTIVLEKNGSRIDVDQVRSTNGSFTWTYVPSSTGTFEITASALEVSASAEFSVSVKPSTPGPENPAPNPPVNPNPNPPTNPGGNNPGGNNPGGNNPGNSTVKPSQEEIDNKIKDPNAKEIKVEINATDSATKVGAELDKNVFASIIQSNKPLVIESSASAISLNNSVLKGIQQTADGSVSISIEQVEAKNITAPETVKGQKIASAILDFNVNVTKADSTTTKVSKFNEAVNVAIKVDASQLTNPRKAAVYYLNETTNKWEYVGGKLVGDSFNFTTNHFSKYAVISNDKSFKDIAGQDWAKEQIEVLASRTIIKGKTEDTFAPGDNITRSQFSILLARALRLPLTSYEGVFTDVSNSSAGASKEIEAAYRAGIVTGVNGKFNPNEPITRQQMAAMIIRAVKYQDNSLVDGVTGSLSFDDASKIDAYAKEYVALAVKLGIITGKENGKIFAPKDNATRSQTAVILYRFLESLKEL